MFGFPPGVNFNPPSPCGEGRRWCPAAGAWPIFQSTLPMRGGTPRLFVKHYDVLISIHPPHAGRDPGEVSPAPRGYISIHPPHAGRDSTAGCICAPAGYFNPPSPCGEGRLLFPFAAAASVISIHPPHAGRDSVFRCRVLAALISIHPPHAGRDWAVLRPRTSPIHFNPPSPCGEGHNGYNVR